MAQCTWYADDTGKEWEGGGYSYKLPEKAPGRESQLFHPKWMGSVGMPRLILQSTHLQPIPSVQLKLIYFHWYAASLPGPQHCVVE